MARGQVERVLGGSQVDRPRVGQQAGEHVGQAGQPGLETRVQDLAGRGQITGAQFGQDLLGPDTQLAGQHGVRAVAPPADQRLGGLRELPQVACRRRMPAEETFLGAHQGRLLGPAAPCPGFGRPRSASPSGTASPTSACSSMANTAGRQARPIPAASRRARRVRPSGSWPNEATRNSFRVHSSRAAASMTASSPAVADPEPDAHQPVHREVEREHRPAHLAPAAGRLGIQQRPGQPGLLPAAQPRTAPPGPERVKHQVPPADRVDLVRDHLREHRIAELVIVAGGEDDQVTVIPVGWRARRARRAPSGIRPRSP